MAARTFEKLLSVLTKETRIQEKLLALLAEERTCIVHLRADELNAMQVKKEKFLDELGRHAEERSTIVSEISKDSQPDSTEPKKAKQPKLTDLVPLCEDKFLRKKLEDVLRELKTVAPATKKLNTENGDLLKHSLGLVSNTIAILSARPSVEDTTYRKNGRVAGAPDAVAPGSAPISSFNRSA
jgi:flagellar biosynthesis/type III secretory pathway chaperone